MFKWPNDKVDFILVLEEFVQRDALVNPAIWYIQCFPFLTHHAIDEFLVLVFSIRVDVDRPDCFFIVLHDLLWIFPSWWSLPFFNLPWMLDHLPSIGLEHTLLASFLWKDKVEVNPEKEFRNDWDLLFLEGFVLIDSPGLEMLRWWLSPCLATKLRLLHTTPRPWRSLGLWLLPLPLLRTPSWWPLPLPAGSLLVIIQHKCFTKRRTDLLGLRLAKPRELRF